MYRCRRDRMVPHWPNARQPAMRFDCSECQCTETCNRARAVQPQQQLKIASARCDPRSVSNSGLWDSVLLLMVQ
eukprot:154966-Rhodomonas_salina.1